MIQSAMAGFDAGDISTCVAMSQAYIGFDLQNAIKNEFIRRGMDKPVVTLVTQVVADKNDPAFLKPSKPIGAFLSLEQAQTLEQQGYPTMEDAGRGYRRVVASPRPVDIVEMDAITALFAAGQVVITCGGGGVPVARNGNHLESLNAVIDKDFASAKLAQLVDADALVILTAVEKVAIHFGKENEQWLSAITTKQARQYMDEGHFAAGSMLPKIQAAIEFAESKPGRTALITLLEKAGDGIQGKTGTIVSNNI
jgi:carbamate kinase